MIPTDVLIHHIGSFLDPKTFVALTSMNSSVRNRAEDVLKSWFEQTFGVAKDHKYRYGKKIFARLLSWANEKPDLLINHNVYKVPSSFFERLKWFAGVENSVDQAVQLNYKTAIDLLENTQATTIFQLQNQMHAFWHTDRQVKDYLKFKTEEKEKISKIGKIFFNCLHYFFRIFYSSSNVYVEKNLEVRSRETYAKIGTFNLNGKHYDVVAFHVLKDLQKQPLIRKTYDTYASESDGFTSIALFERNIQINTPKFSVSLGRKSDRNKWLVNENSWGTVFRDQRYLIIRNLSYSTITRDAVGSDRLVDQKLTQVMVEMLMQNNNIRSIEVTSNHADFAMLSTAGFSGKRDFDAEYVEEVKNKVREFRLQVGNHLYPPYRDYSSWNLQLNTQDLESPNVYFTRAGVESWSEIISRAPILHQGAGVLPEYWVYPPKFA